MSKTSSGTCSTRSPSPATRRIPRWMPSPGQDEHIDGVKATVSEAGYVSTGTLVFPQRQGYGDADRVALPGPAHGWVGQRQPRCGCVVFGVSVGFVTRFGGRWNRVQFSDPLGLAVWDDWGWDWAPVS
jgi:hypothetical protein